jgi:hypothetical protein
VYPEVPPHIVPFKQHCPKKGGKKAAAAIEGPWRLNLAVTPADPYIPLRL